MTNAEALQLIEYIPIGKVKSSDMMRLHQLTHAVHMGISLDQKESSFLQDIYRYTNGGGDKESQPFKQYRRSQSKGI